MDLRISLEPEASEADQQVVRWAIDERNMLVTRQYDYRPVALFLRDEAGAIQGGLLAELWGGWCHVSYLWVAEELRGRDYGTQLLQACEDEARAGGCAHIRLETFDFQAPRFYQRFGYQVFAELPDYPGEHRLYFLEKDL